MKGNFQVPELSADMLIVVIVLAVLLLILAKMLLAI